MIFHALLIDSIDFWFYSAQNHKGQQQRIGNDFNSQIHPPSRLDHGSNQTPQQRSTNQLQTINEILLKSKSMLNNFQKNPVQMKVFPEDPPAPPPSQQKAAGGSNSANDKKLLKITLNRLDPEHIEQMGKSVSEFAKNSPESAKKLGVIRDELDMFSLIKGDERNLKRKPENDVCPCK